MNWMITAILCCSQAAVLILAIRSVKESVDWASGRSAFWREELLVKRCGMMAATERNLRDAALALSDRHLQLSLDEAPETDLDQGRTEKALLGSAEALIVQMMGYYETAPSCDGSEKHWRLFLQEHPKQPARWPNWVMRYVKRREGAE